MPKFLLLCFFLLIVVATPSLAATRHYYIAAEDVTWDFAPSGQDLLHGVAIPAPWSLQTKWKKTRYIEYTDSTFSVRKIQPEWLGIMGPIIRAEVGDTIVVEFLNRSNTAHSIHPHGLRYDKANEGSFYLPFGSGYRVPPGGRFTYRWFADEGSGPGPGDASSIAWWYHSHTDESIEMNQGLLGAIIITAKGKARPDGTPKEVDQEFVTMFMIFDELHTAMTGRHMAYAGPNAAEAGLFYSINGYVFGNLPGLAAKKGSRVRWYLMGMGNENDLHTPHWHAKTVTFRHRHVDVVELLPASTATADMLADNPGTWLFHCQVADHMEGGMMATYTIYIPQARSCPVKISDGDFWDAASGKFKLAVQNESSKTIKSVVFSAFNLYTSNYLRRPYIDAEWRSDESLAPHASEPLEREAFLKNFRDKILGLAFLPKLVKYSDGTTWTPDHEGECFQIFWRDKVHPDLQALPTLQFETNED